MGLYAGTCVSEEGWDGEGAGINLLQSFFSLLQVKVQQIGVKRHTWKRFVEEYKRVRW